MVRLSCLALYSCSTERVYAPVASSTPQGGLCFNVSGLGVLHILKLAMHDLEMHTKYAVMLINIEYENICVKQSMSIAVARADHSISMWHCTVSIQGRRGAWYVL